MAPQFKGAPGGGSAPFARLQGRRITLRTAALAAGGAALAGGAGLSLHRHRTRLATPAAPPQRLLLPRGLAEVICGAVGEIVQVACLYPLDTIKVRCQATSSSAARVAADMVRANGGLFAPALWRQLYAGAIGASLLSVAVGALYYSSFCAAKRHLLRWAADGERAAAARAAAAGAADALPPPGGAGGRKQQQAAAGAHATPHGPPVDYHHDAALAIICSSEADANRAAARNEKAERRRSRKQQQQQQQAAEGAGAGAAGAGAAGAAAASSSGASGSEAGDEGISSGGRLRANVAAAAAAALVGAVVEAPVELFKHQLQAGHISGSILGHMGSAVRMGGPAALFVSMLPFCLKSLPFDTVELLTYSSLADARDALPPAGAAAAGAAPGPRGLRERLAAAAAAARDHPFVDLGMGAAAGAAAVLVSQPMDTIKTVVETGGGAAAAGAGQGSARAFVDTGRALMARHGAGALFAGMSMRLAEQVPSTALYWIAVEGMRRTLEPYVAK
ncbi:MAG: mitochondrial carrier domain-containing protein [Monoraphidium minutum]|nr:MAG: mitochondrial carrier domain-containing protein [Monoraphidium minutum]